MLPVMSHRCGRLLSLLPGRTWGRVQPGLCRAAWPMDAEPRARQGPPEGLLGLCQAPGTRPRLQC